MIIKEQKSRTGNMYQFVDDTWNPIVANAYMNVLIVM